MACLISNRGGYHNIPYDGIIAVIHWATIFVFDPQNFFQCQRRTPENALTVLIYKNQMQGYAAALPILRKDYSKRLRHASCFGTDDVLWSWIFSIFLRRWSRQAVGIKETPLFSLALNLALCAKFNATLSPRHSGLLSNDIHRHVMRLRIRQDLKDSNCKVDTGISTFWHSIMVGVPAVLWKSIAKVNSVSPIKKVYASLRLWSIRVVWWKLVLETDCVLNWVGLLLVAVISEIFYYSAGNRDGTTTLQDEIRIRRSFQPHSPPSVING